MAAGATYEPIATQTLASATTSITFSSIPSTYTDLRIVTVKLGSSQSYCALRCNGDTATNYSWLYLTGDGTSTASSYATNDTSISAGGYLAALGTTPYLMTADVFSYLGSTYKSVLTTLANDQNGSGQVANTIGIWRSTSAVTSLTVFSNANFDVGSTFTLYGIKAA